MSRTIRSRVALLVLAVLAIGAGVVHRLVRCQILQHGPYIARADRQHTQEAPIAGRRGAILDRHGRVLAASLDCWSLWARPQSVRDADRAARELARWTGLARSRIRRQLEKDSPRLWIRRGLDHDAAAGLRASGLLDDDVFGLDKESCRSYPGGELAAHVVGFAGVDQNGVSGIERSRHDDLQGSPAFAVRERDALGHGFVRELRPPDKPHRDVVLTLDAVLQHLVERELDAAMRESGADAAWAVLLDPRTGEVLAMATRPTPTLDDYPRSTFRQQRNRAVLDRYEPGSTFKIVTAAAALEERIVRPDTAVNCRGGEIQIRDRTYRDHERFDVLSFADVLRHSSNVGMIVVSRRLSEDVLFDYARRFGFGAVTGVGLKESAGELPDVSESREVGLASFAIGYGVSVTALQMAAAVSTVANDGVRPSPHIVLGTRAPSGRWYPEEAPAPRRVISERTARTLGRLLEAVVDGGTGSEARIPGYRVAGKTGTARRHVEGQGYVPSRYYASFAGFAPVEAPRIACVVVLDSPEGARYFGGQTAAPVFSRIVGEALTHLRVPSNDPIRMARRTAPDSSRVRGTGVGL